MKSIKPGRGPSMMGAIVCIAIAVFGVLWVIMASDITSSFPGSSSLGGEFVFEESMTLDTYGSPMNSIGSIFPLFGVIFVVIAIALADKWHVAKFKYCRIATDLVCVVSGVALFLLAGGQFAQIPSIAGVGTIITAFFMGPLIELFNERIARPMLGGQSSAK